MASSADAGRRPLFTRRRVTRTAAAVGIALLGAGFLRPGGSAERPPLTVADPADAPPRRRLTLVVRDDRTPSRAPEIAAPAGTGSDGGPTVGRTPDSDAGDPVTVIPSDRGTDRRDDSDASGGSSGESGGGGGPSPPTVVASPERDLTLAAPPVDLSGLVPGDEGTITLDLTLDGAPAALWMAATGVDGGENGLTEPERAVGDATAAGELAEAVRVTAWLDDDGDGRAGPGETVAYRGSLVGLSALADGTSLVACATAGTHRVRLRWRLPATTGDEVQTDRASLALRFGATDCGAPSPFAADAGTAA